MTAPPASDRSVRRFRRTLVVLVSIAVATACFGGWIAYAKKADRSERQDPQAALTLYLQRVQRGDHHAAYGQLCVDVLAGYSEQDHAQFLREQGVFSSFSLGAPTKITGMDGTYLSFPAHLTYPDATTGVDNFTVGLQTNGPKICDGPGRRH